MSKFVHLHTHSHYSLLDGLSRVPKLVAAAKKDGQQAIALTDHGSMYGAIEFYKTATKAGVKPIIGVEAYYAPQGRTVRTSAGAKRTNHLILLAKNIIGYKHLLRLVSEAHLSGFYYKPRIDWELLGEYGEGLIALSGCLGGELAQAILHDPPDVAEQIVRRFRDRFGDDYYLEMQRRRDTPEQVVVNKRLIELAQSCGVGLVATNDSHYLAEDDAEAQDVMLCIQTKSKQTDTNRLSMAGEHYGLRSASEMALLFEDRPDAIANTVAIAERCNVELELGKIQLPSFPIPKGTTYDAELRARCEERIAARYPSAEEHALSVIRERLDYELGVISEMGYASYFLIVRDFVNWSKDRGIVVGPGRGSAAGSIVAYLCNITNLDPIAYELLFERFLAPGRIQMPDIDIDFADHRRDEVIQYVKEKYGDDCVAQIITFGTMAARASVRDVGRVLDVPYTFCDRLAKLIPTGATLDDAERDVDELRLLLSEDETTRRLFDIAKRLEGAVRHTSTHACGVVISAKPLVEYLPIQRASADDDTIVTQFEMHAVEDLGLLKMDFLGLSNLSIIERAVELIRERGDKVDIDHLPLDDARTYALLQGGMTTGVFQLESGGMKRYLKDLKPTEFEDIIAMVSLYRPGPMELIPEYIDRKFGRSVVTYMHPKLESVLKPTYGIMVYQEQLMRLARDLAGFSMAEADTLRKAVGKKIKSLLDQQRTKLIDGMIANGIHATIAKKIWAWIEPFARYGFNRSHGACYAMIAYQTAYLKAHYPSEFMCALLTSERAHTDRLAVLIQECRQMGMTVLGPDLNESDAMFSVVESSDSSESGCIRFGLAAVKNVGESVVRAMTMERKERGPFRDLEDVLRRVHDKDFNKKSLESLVRCGALDQFGERAKLLQNMNRILTYQRSIADDQASGQENLFGASGARVELQLLDVEPAPERLRLGWEKELLGLYVTSHPFEEIAKDLGKTIASVSEIRGASSGANVRFGGVITRVKRIVTKKGDAMLFAEVEDHTGAIEVVVFPRTLEASPQVWMADTIIMLSGKTSDRDGAPKILASNAVQVVSGRAREALAQLGGSNERLQSARTFTQATSGRCVLPLPESWGSAELAQLRKTLERHPGPMPVRLRSGRGTMITTGMQILLTDGLRAELAAMLGAEPVVEEREEAVPVS
jgi:DNA polymerase III subunit alpha